MKNNKSAGENGIPAEVFKYGGVTLKAKISQLIKLIWREETIPSKWGYAVIYPIHKKSVKADCRNYRSIALLDIVYKVLAKLLRKRLEYLQEEMIGEYQGRFRGGKGTSDQIYTIK